MSSANHEAPVVVVLADLATLIRTIVRDELNAHRERLEPAYMTRSDVARLLHVHPNVVASWIREKGLPARKIGSIWRLRRADVVAWFAAQPVRHPPRPQAPPTSPRAA